MIGCVEKTLHEGIPGNRLGGGRALPTPVLTEEHPLSKEADGDYSGRIK